MQIVDKGVLELALEDKYDGLPDASARVEALLRELRSHRPATAEAFTYNHSEGLSIDFVPQAGGKWSYVRVYGEVSE
jgi:hypothetical protein